MITKHSIKVFTLLWLIAAPLFAQVEEGKVKSLFIYNFTRYIEWPDVNSTFTIGVMGNDPDILAAFKNMAARKSNPTTKIIIKQFSDPSEASGFNLVYIPESNSSAIKQVSGLSKTLIVTEKSGMTKYGSDINFVQQNGKIRFELNQKALDKSDLKVSSQLLTLAIVV